MLDQVEEGLLSPLDVVEDDDERSGRLEQLAEGPGDLLTRRQDVLAEERADGLRGLRLHLDVCQLLDDLDDRPVGDPLAVGKAAAANHAHPGLGDHLGRQPRLSDPGRPEHGHQLAARSSRARSQALRNVARSSSRPTMGASNRRVGSRRRDEPVSGNRLGLAL